MRKFLNSKRLKIKEFYSKIIDFAYQKISRKNSLIILCDFMVFADFIELF